MKARRALHATVFISTMSAIITTKRSRHFGDRKRCHSPCALAWPPAMPRCENLIAPGCTRQKPFSSSLIFR